MKTAILLFVCMLGQQAFAAPWNPKDLGGKSLSVESCKLVVTDGSIDSNLVYPDPTYWGPSTDVALKQVQPNKFIGTYNDLEVTIMIAPTLGQANIDLINYTRLVSPTFRMEVADSSARVLKAVNGFITYANDFIVNEYTASNSAVFHHVCKDGRSCQSTVRTLNTQDDITFLNRQKGTALNLKGECQLIAK